jgi:hypothetical protein
MIRTLFFSYKDKRTDKNTATVKSFWCICFTVRMIEVVSDGEPPTAAPADAAAAVSVAASSGTQSVTFNNKVYDGWEEALSAARALKNKNQDKASSLWYRTDIVHEADGSFSMRCASCHKGFAPKNPANFWQTHKAACTTANRGSELTRGELSHLHSSIAKNSSP